jgi:hypothetical protein
MYNKLIIIFSCIFFLTIGSCALPEGEGIPFDSLPAVTPKILSVDNKSQAELILMVNTENQNPLNAAAYFLQNNTGNIPLFDYVILSYAYLGKERGYTSIILTPSLQHILDNSVKYLKPLKAKGIKVLVEIRSGNFLDTEGGVSAGFGTMDVAAIDEFIKRLNALVQKYGIDGFDFNDTGGGLNAYSPHTENLKQFQKDIPLYKDTLFKDADGNRLPENVITAKLWREGGSNFTNLLQRANEVFKEKYTSVLSNGAASSTEMTRLLVRSFMAHDTKHGQYLLAQLRNEYMPDAYSGADQNLLGNVRYVLHDDSWDRVNYAHMSLYNESEGRDTGAVSDGKYAPFAVDLQNRPGGANAETTALDWATAFADESGDRYKYGGLLFKNLPPASSAGYDAAAYLSIFTQKLFGRSVVVSGTASHTKDW